MDHYKRKNLSFSKILLYTHIVLNSWWDNCLDNQRIYNKHQQHLIQNFFNTNTYITYIHYHTYIDRLNSHLFSIPQKMQKITSKKNYNLLPNFITKVATCKNSKQCMARAQKYLFYGAYSLTEKVILTMCRKWHDCIGLLYFILWLVQKILTTIFIDQMQKENQLPLGHSWFSHS